MALAFRGNPKLCLENSGGRLILNNCNGGSNQKWIFNSGDYQNYMQIQLAADTNICIDAGNMQKGAALSVVHCNGGPSQTWARDIATGLVYIPDNNMAMDA